MKDFIEREHSAILQTYKRLPIVVERAEGARIYDKEGNVYLDFLAGIAVNALGHSHPKIISAATEQINKYMHISNYFYQEPQIKLAEKLLSHSGLSKVFFSNSGTEATEGAIKLIRKNYAGSDKKTILAFDGGFHGRTYGALSIMDKPNYKNGMEPFLTDTKVIEHNNIEVLKQNINESTAAVFLEFVQGEGGIVEPSLEFVATLTELKAQFGFLLVADEIQAGTGRTGKFFGYEHFGIKPDIITLAKGMGGGLPLGAIIVAESLANVWEKGNHGTTYGGNAVAAATGLVVVEELENGLLDHVEQIGTYFREKLKVLSEKFDGKVLEVRGRGLMLGLLLSFDASILVEKLLERRIIANAASGKVLRIVPPLVVNEDDINEFLSGLEESIKDIDL